MIGWLLLSLSSKGSSSQKKNENVENGIVILYRVARM